MSREFHFRAWDIKEKKMRFQWEDSVLIEIYGFNDNFNDNKTWVVMQDTGLKDINGKPIYEGDILEHKQTFETNNVRTIHTSYYTVEYGRHNCGCCFPVYGYYFKPSFNTKYDLYDLDNVKVVGNIYESEDFDRWYSEVVIEGDIISKENKLL